MSKIKDKTDALLDELQAMMEANKHLINPADVQEVVDKCSLYWAHLDDEGRDYVHGVQWAIDEKIEWKV